MNTTEGILLGLSTGVICLAYCGPVLVPYLLGENRNINSIILYVSLFLLGRLAAYLAVGFVAGLTGRFLIDDSALNIFVTGIIYILLSGLLIFYGFYQFKEVCLGKTQAKIAMKLKKRIPYLVPVTGGILTGLNICPPFVLAITKAATTQNIQQSIIFFVMFFIGTSVYFFPLPFLGYFKRQKVLRIVGKFAAIVAGFVYLYQGILMTIN